MINWLSDFPYKEPREQQKRVIDKIIESFTNEEKRYAIIDCGTGVGKSAIGLTIAKYLNSNSNFEGTYEPGAYFLTTQKILQKQYEDDFALKSGLVSLYSSILS